MLPDRRPAENVEQESVKLENGTAEMQKSENEAYSAEAADERDYPRYEVNTTGTAILDTGFRISFVVKDLSQRGAKILLNKTTILPHTFVVEITSPDKTKLKRCDASRQWQRGPLVGIRLLNSKTIKL